MKNYTHTAFEILDMMYYINVATCDDKMVPWNSIVYWAFDRDLNIFWSSAVDAVHSKNISIHPHVFFTVYDSTTPLGVFRQQGVYIQANARELVDPEEIAYAREITQSRKGKKSGKDASEFTGMARRRVYQATPEKIWINDVDESSAAIRDIRVEVETTELQKVLRGHFFLKKKLSEVDRSAADEDE